MATRAVPRKSALPATPAKAAATATKPAKAEIKPAKVLEKNLDDEELIEDDTDTDEDEESDSGEKRTRRSKTSNFFDIVVDRKHYRAHSDKHGWTVSLRSTNKDGSFYYIAEAYCSSFIECLMVIRRRALNTSKYKKLSTVIANSIRIDAEIRSYLNDVIPSMTQEQLEEQARVLIKGLGAR